MQQQVEQSLVLIKPDALKNSVTGFLLSQLSEYHTGSRFAAAKIVQVNRMLAEQHYAEHRGKAFYNPLIEYIMGCAHYPNDAGKRRVIAIVSDVRTTSGGLRVAGRSYDLLPGSSPRTPMAFILWTGEMVQYACINSRAINVRCPSLGLWRRGRSFTIGSWTHTIPSLRPRTWRSWSPRRAA